jgi:hypothetical protein
MIRTGAWRGGPWVVAAGMLAALAGACGGRPDVWSEPTSSTQVFALARSVALVDPPAHRVVSLGVRDVGGGLALGHTAFGQGGVTAAAAPAGDKLYVLSSGHRAALGDSMPEERPALTVISDAVTDAGTGTTIDLGLTDPLDGLAIDPSGRWAVVYAASPQTTTLVTNPNQLVIVDLALGTASPHTLHSFGGRPERLIFTPALGLPSGSHPLLIVQSDQDLALLVLDPAVPDKEEVTVRLTDASVAARRHPAQVVVDDGDPLRDDDARLGIRFDGDTSVMMLQLGRAAGGGGGLSPSVNVADVSGVPTDIAFVRTDGGLQLAALIPGRAILVDPVTTIATTVMLPASYQRISLVTAAAGGSSTDLALLWGGGSASAGVAFWELGQVAGRPFRSIETVGVSADVSDVLDVPLPDAALKVLATAGGDAFYVLDLSTRTAAPLVTIQPNLRLSVSPKGRRVWSFLAGGLAIASTSLPGKQVRTLRADSAVDEVVEIGNLAADGRSLVALHEAGGVGATIYGVEAIANGQPVETGDDTQRRIYGALLTEGPYEAQ